MTKGSAAVAANLRRAAQSGLPATLTDAAWAQTVHDFRGLCAYCSREEYVLIEHFVPCSSGGGTTAGNCLPACAACNSIKRARLPDVAACAFQSGRIEALRLYLMARSSAPSTGQGMSITVRVDGTTKTLLDEWREEFNAGHAFKLTRWQFTSVVLAWSATHRPDIEACYRSMAATSADIEQTGRK